MNTGSHFSESQDDAQARAWPESEGRLATPQADASASAHAVPQAQPVPQTQMVPQAQAVPQVIVPKNPALGVILSFFIPGLGSMVNGSVGRGAIIMVVDFVGWILAFFIIGIPIVIGAWIWGMIDGYLSAQRWNQAHGIIS